jgi:cellobiose-specific phosphotransferase system component IIC
MGYLVVANTSAEKEFTERIAGEMRILIAVICLSVIAAGVCLWYPFRKKKEKRK